MGLLSGQDMLQSYFYHMLNFVFNLIVREFSFFAVHLDVLLRFCFHMHGTHHLVYKILSNGCSQLGITKDPR